MLYSRTIQIHHSKVGGSNQSRDTQVWHSQPSLSKRQGGWRTTVVALVHENAIELRPQTFPASRSSPLTTFGLNQKLVDEMPIAHHGRHWFFGCGSLWFQIQLTNAIDSDHKLGTHKMLYTRTVRIHDAKVGGSKF